MLLLANAVKALLEMLAPVTAQLPAGVEFRQATAILLVVGLVVRTDLVLRTKNAFEQPVLEKLPGYTFLRGLAKPTLMAGSIYILPADRVHPVDIRSPRRSTSSRNGDRRWGSCEL